MYGAAGWQHTPGAPRNGAKLKQKANVGRPIKDRTNYNKANQASARQHGVR